VIHLLFFFVIQLCTVQLLILLFFRELFFRIKVKKKRFLLVQKKNCDAK